MKKQTSVKHIGAVVLSSVVCLLVLATAYCFLLKHDIAQERERYRYIAENEALVGFNFLDISHPGNLEAKAAYEQDVTILTNPFELVQGGLGMAGRAPVILHDGTKQTLWGLVTVTIDFDNLIDMLQIGNLSGMGMEYALSYIDPDGTAQIMHGGVVDADAITTRFAVRNLAWELAAACARLTWRLADWRGEKAGSLSLAFGFAARKEFPGAGFLELSRTADKRMYDDKAAFHQREEGGSRGQCAP